jgi:hypothetical protein
LAAGQPFLNNTVSNIASAWFGDNEVKFKLIKHYFFQRVLASALLGLSAPLGSIFGMVIPTLYITKDIDPEEGKANFYNYIILQNIVTTAMCVPLILIARSKPPTPPS